MGSYYNVINVGPISSIGLNAENKSNIDWPILIIGTEPRTIDQAQSPYLPSVEVVSKLPR